MSYPRIDYLGPDVDAGFRISKCSHPGLMVISSELAELLSETEVVHQLKGVIVGWARLKSVRDDQPYPIIWITLPTDQDVDYEPFEPWEVFESGYAEWKQRTRTEITELKSISGEIRQTRKKQPSSLGLVRPYIVSEGDAMPPNHRKIHMILDWLPKGIAEAQEVGQEPQNVSEEGVTEADNTDEEESFQELTDKRSAE